MRVGLTGLSVQERADAAWREIIQGADPYEMLYAALWPDADASMYFEQDEPRRYRRHDRCIGCNGHLDYRTLGCVRCTNRHSLRRRRLLRAQR